MNNEMMPLIIFLLQSEDLKKQSDRIIQAVQESNDAKKFMEEFLSSVSNTEAFKANMESSKIFLESIHELKGSVDELKTKIDGITFSMNPGKIPLLADDNNSALDKKTTKR